MPTCCDPDMEVWTDNRLNLHFIITCTYRPYKIHGRSGADDGSRL